MVNNATHIFLPILKYLVYYMIKWYYIGNQIKPDLLRTAKYSPFLLFAQPGKGLVTFDGLSGPVVALLAKLKHAWAVWLILRPQK